MDILIESTKTLIRSVHERSYFEKAPQRDPATGLSPAYPYVTFVFPSSNAVFRREDFILEVDLWGNDPDTTALEELTSAVDAVLDRKMVFIKNELAVRFYRVNRSMIPDPDDRLRHRQLRYECKTYLETYFV